MLREITFDSKKIPAFLDGAINAMALYKQTGIINKFDKCTVTAPIDYTTTGYGTITFNDGAIVICGRVIYIEAGTTLAIPITTTAGGSIGVKVDLNQNAGSQVAFYSKTTQTLTQQDLNENKTDGIYEFEIFKYTSNGTTLTLTYQTASVFDANEDILKIVYPVGSIYISVVSTNPTTLFGGTWQQLQDRFLLGAGSTYANGATGGEATHTLTIDEIPNHNHGIYTTIFAQLSGNNIAKSGSTSGSSTKYTDNVGGGEAHNNMPPYLVVYMWKRTA